MSLLLLFNKVTYPTAITTVQTAEYQTPSGSSPSPNPYTLTLPHAATSGNTLICICSYGAFFTQAIQTPPSSPWVEVSNYTPSSGNSEGLVVFSLSVTSSSQNYVTIGHDGSDMQILLLELHGVSAVDSFNATVNPSGYSFTTSSVTLLNGDMAIAAFSQDSGSGNDGSPQSGWTEYALVSNGYNNLDVQTYVANSTQTVSGSWGNNNGVLPGYTGVGAIFVAHLQRQSQTYNYYPTDTVTTSDSLSRLAELLRSSTTTFTFSDSQTLQKILSRSPIDSFTTSATSTQQQFVNRSTSDTSLFSDAISRLQDITRLPADTFSTSDALTVQQIIARNLSDTFNRFDTLSRELIMMRSFSDTTSTSSSVTLSQYLSRLLTDTHTTSDSLSSIYTLYRATTDTMTVSDALNVSKIIASSLVDTISTSDSLSHITVLTRTLVDTLSFVDSLSGTQNVHRSLTETFGTSDAINRLLTLTRTFADTFSTGSGLSAGKSFTRNLSDTTVISDILANNNIISRMFNENNTTSDIINRFTNVSRSQTDTSNFSDSLSDSGAEESRNLVELLNNFQDNLTAAQLVHRSNTDSLEVSDILTRVVTFLRTNTDTTTLLSSLLAFSIFSRGVAEFLATNDSLNHLFVYDRSIHDILAFNDELSRMIIFDKNLEENLSLESDSIIRIMDLTRTMSEILVTYEELLRGASAAFIPLYDDTGGTWVTVSSFASDPRGPNETFITSDSNSQQLKLKRTINETFVTIDVVKLQQQINPSSHVQFMYQGAFCQGIVEQRVYDNQEPWNYRIQVTYCSNWNIFQTRNPKIVMNITQLTVLSQPPEQTQ